MGQKESTIMMSSLYRSNVLKYYIAVLYSEIQASQAKIIVEKKKTNKQKTPQTKNKTITVLLMIKCTGTLNQMNPLKTLLIWRRIDLRQI